MSSKKNKRHQASEAPIESPKAALAMSKISVHHRLENWLSARQWRVLAALVVLWAVMRIICLSPMANKPLLQLNDWQETDNHFFNEWAQHLAYKDWLNSTPLHPYHGWHQTFAEQYFKSNPGKLQDILAANPNRDSTFTPGKVLWNDWYGDVTYHQEPLYAYLLALIYRLTGDGPFWMLALQGAVGVSSGVLLWLLAKRYFNQTVALITGLLYLFSGTLLFQEGLLLRTSWIVFFTLLCTWIFQRAMDRPTVRQFALSGLIFGLAFLLQSSFLLFLPIALAVYFTTEQKFTRANLRNAGLMVGIWILTLQPVVIRNSLVDVPLWRFSSIGAITFVATNVQGTQAVSSWRPAAEPCSEIMGKTNGQFLPAVTATLATHSFPSYLQLIWSKLTAMIDGREWPNNESFYFYRETIPMLKVAFFDFYWIGFLGATGLMMSMVYPSSRRPKLLVAAVLTQVIILLGFYVLGRLRAPLAALMLPFAAFALSEILKIQTNNLQIALRKSAFFLVGFLVFFLPFYKNRKFTPDFTDYNVLYELAYFERIKSNAEARRYNVAIASHEDFLRYRPAYLDKLTTKSRLNDPAEIALVDYFSNQYEINYYLYEDSGNKRAAANAMVKSKLLDQVVQESRRRLGK